MSALQNRHGWLVPLALCFLLATVPIEPAKGDEAVSVSDAYNFKKVNEQLSTSGILSV